VATIQESTEKLIANVNISAMHLGRSAPRADALMVLALDDPVPDAVAGASRG